MSAFKAWMGFLTFIALLVCASVLANGFADDMGWLK